ncbi:hypothetical protein SS50377_26488 [Spironucleus salmonicida]|uniref:Uncharacterized protein n=1 Tax=Spironucleus salmonicida TaxID=348837 RepID=A0A9P8LQE7_9EUKA|nr:hypothetical protein SS50377_26488 [Spironucleus salmonicida]
MSASSIMKFAFNQDKKYLSQFGKQKFQLHDQSLLSCYPQLVMPGLESIFTQKQEFSQKMHRSAAFGKIDSKTLVGMERLPPLSSQEVEIVSRSMQRLTKYQGAKEVESKEKKVRLSPKLEFKINGKIY